MVAYFFGPPCRRQTAENGVAVEDPVYGQYEVKLILTLFHKCCRRRLYQMCVESHTRTVVRESFKADEASQWKRPKFDPSPHQNPLTDLHKN